MDTWVWQPFAYLVAVGYHWAGLVSGVLVFLLSLWFAHRGKTITFGIFVLFAIGCLFLSGYLAWRDEYLKSIGEAEFSFSLSESTKPEAADVVAKFTIRNDTPTNYEIKEIALGRVLLVAPDKDIASLGG